MTVRDGGKATNVPQRTTWWAQLLHFYQPPTQTHQILKRVTEESYRPLLAVLRAHPAARVAVNMNAVLTEMLDEHGLGDVVEGLKELGERGQVEFVGSGKFHPVLPLIPQRERARSIAENAQTNHRLLGTAWQPRGFFPPEMCYSAEMMPDIAAAGHEWVVMSGVACPDEWTSTQVYRAPAGTKSLAVLFRDDVRSNRISFRETTPVTFLEDLERVSAHEDGYVLTAMDAETYGHHIQGWETEFLAATYRLLDNPGAGAHARHRVKMAMPSEIVAEFPAGPVVEPLPSSWSTTLDDIAAKNPYPLWDSPGNRVHELQWEYVHHCHELLTVAERYAESEEAKMYAGWAANRIQPALHSCQFWWASRRPMWDVPMIHRGFQLLNEVALYAMKSVRLGGASERVKREAAWRMAAANEARAELERHLFGEGAR